MTICPGRLFVGLGSTASYDGMIGAEAALLLLEEMKMSPNATGVSPDIFTYTTVISGVARAEVRLNPHGRLCTICTRVSGSHLLTPAYCCDGEIIHERC